MAAAAQAAAAHQARTAAAAHQARTAAEQAAVAHTEAAQEVAAHTEAAQEVAAHTEVAQEVAAQPFLHFCGSAFEFCGDQACGLASRCATAPADPLQSASSWLACKTAGAAS